MSTSSGVFVHTMKHCYATALYTTEAQALSITHARISLLHACNHERSSYTEGLYTASLPFKKRLVINMIKGMHLSCPVVCHSLLPKKAQAPS